jgi:LuxR family transcriptional regulator
MERSCNDLFGMIHDCGPVACKIALRHRQKEPMVKKIFGPPGWIDHYNHNAYVYRDPVMMYAFSKEGVSCFENLGFPDPCGVLLKAASFGLKYGIVAAVGPAHAKSFCIVSRSDRPYREEEKSRVLRCLTVLHYMHERKSVRLTPSEREALRIMAAGMNYETAGLELGISFSAVKARLTKARRKLGVKTTLEAVHEAHRTGLM